MSMQRKICWGAVAVTGLLFSSIGLEPAAGQGAAWQVQEVEASAPYRIFYQGDEIRFTARVQTGAELGQSVALVARQLRHRVPEHLPKDTAPEQNVVKSGWENIPGPAFEAGEATVKRDGQTLVLDCDVQIETLGAIRLLARHDGKEYKLADFLHVLPFNGVKPDEAVFTLNSVRRAEQADERFALYKRMGIQLVRAGGRTWEKDTMHLDWEFYDTLLAAMKKHDMRANFVIGGASMKMASYVQGEDEKWHTLIRYRGGSTPETTPSTEYLDVWAEQMGELARRFKGYARGYDFFNEPWELGSVSGTISGGAHIRRLIEWGAPAIKAADPGTKILAASSGPNALDSYLPYPKTTDAMDVMTMHTYSLQSMGAFLAPKYDLEVWDTESWEPMMERNLPMKVAHQIHQGYGAIKPMNQAESPAEARQASWAVVITAQRMLEGMKPAGYAMEGKVPVVLLYEGRGHAAAFIHGTSEYYGSKFYNPTPLRQIERNAANNGWGPWTIGHYVVPAEGLTVRDVYGNPLASEGDVYRIPLGQSGVYVTADNIDQLREAMQAGQLRGVKPFTIAIRDITERLQPGAEVRVKLTNVYPTPKKAAVSLDGHGVLDFGGRTVSKTLPAGQSATFSFPVVEVADHPGNAYRITARAENEGQTYSYGENINVAVIARGTVEIDGDLDDWKKLDAVPVRVSDQIGRASCRERV